MDEQEKYGISIDERIGVDPVCLVPHRRHIESLKQHVLRGHNIVVWSAGGADWAEIVVKALKLEKYVDLIVAKPTWWYDDLQADLILFSSNRIYKEDDRNY